MAIKEFDISLTFSLRQTISEITNSDLIHPILNNINQIVRSLQVNFLKKGGSNCSSL